MTLLVSWVTQRLRVQGCATIPHCAPLERGDWTCRAAIDISLLWSERQNRTESRSPVSFGHGGVASWFFNRCNPSNRC